MANQDHTRAAWAALLAVFCAHVFAVLITEAPRIVRVDLKTPVLAAAGGASTKTTLATMPGKKTGTNRPTADTAVPDVDDGETVTTPRDRVVADDKLAAYQGLGSWVDLFNRGPWRDPSGTVRKMHRRGVRTIYLQTSTYGSPAHIVHPRKVGAFIASAHARGMFVIGWSVPSFVDPDKDFRRAAAAIRFRTKKGEAFDSFGLDIEADIVKNIGLRNYRLMQISRGLRRVAGKDYPLGAIIPDPHSLYWPDFPYKRVAAVYDVIVPMGYFTFSARGYKDVRRYTEKNIRAIRRGTGDRRTPIHVIGGIADDVGVAAARGFIKAIKKHRALGASLYDFPITSKKTWKELKSVPAAPRSPARPARP